jgi:hypothetical protein
MTGRVINRVGFNPTPHQVGSAQSRTQLDINWAYPYLELGLFSDNKKAKGRCFPGKRRPIRVAVSHQATATQGSPSVLQQWPFWPLRLRYTATHKGRRGRQSGGLSWPPHKGRR